MNPYEARADKIPEGDRYSDVPLYGRYHPAPDDFHPDPKHVNSTSSADESLAYWEEVLLTRCDESVRIYHNDEGGRDVFALGSVIVKSSHLKPHDDDNDGGGGRRACRDYGLADQNEVQAIALVRNAFSDLVVGVPEIYFAGQIRGRAVLVQSRIPGVGLNIAWQYLTPAQKTSFKRQTREIMRRLHTLRSPYRCPSYVVPDPDPVGHRGVQELERELLFGERDLEDADLGFVHNDTTPSNIIVVDDDKIAAIVDWEMAGYFGWKRAAEVHRQIRSPKRENYAHLNLDEDFLADVLCWNDLYEGETASKDLAGVESAEENRSIGTNNRNS